MFVPQSSCPSHFRRPGYRYTKAKSPYVNFTWKEITWNSHVVWILREIHVKIFTWVSLLTLVSREKFHVKFTWNSREFHTWRFCLCRCMAGVSNISYIGPHRPNNPEAHIVLRLSKRCSCNVFFYHFRLVVGQTPMVLVQWQVAFQVVRPMSVPSIIQRSHIDAYWSDIDRLLTRVRTDICR